MVKELDSEFPFGFDDQLFEVKGSGEQRPYKAMWYETDDIMYLIKFDKYINTRSKDVIKSADKQLRMEEEAGEDTGAEFEMDED